MHLLKPKAINYHINTGTLQEAMNCQSKIYPFKITNGIHHLARVPPIIQVSAMVLVFPILLEIPVFNGILFGKKLFSILANLLCNSDYDEVLELAHSKLKEILTLLYMKTILRNETA